ncbi:MAG: ribonuclease III, partial [Oscillospiraceae bacterium]|nr:ribonuclease III [Oscillospiraceae bacterium]
MEALEQKLGYVFRSRELLGEALNHSSYANEHRGSRILSNERLEFLGDSILGFVTAEHLFKTYPDLPEGDLTRIRAALVCEQSLYEVALELNLGAYLKLGRGEEAGGGRERQSILADAVEAVFAAVYLDSDMASVSELIHRVLLDRSDKGVVEERKDYKTALQELVQREEGRTLTYQMTGESGPDHNKTLSERSSSTRWISSDTEAMSLSKYTAANTAST